MCTGLLYLKRGSDTREHHSMSVIQFPTGQPARTNTAGPGPLAPGERRPPLSIPLRLPVALTAMIVMVGLLCLGHVLTTLLPLLQGNVPGESAHLLDLGRENNLPTWYATLSLFICALILCLVGWAKHCERDSFRRHWLALAAGFLLLSADEAASIHELVGRSLESRIHFQGVLYYGSIVPMLGGVVLIAFTFFRFWWHLPLHTRVRVAVAGVLYLGGAVGCEMLESQEEFRTHSQGTTAYHLMVFVEEVLEMSGVLIFLHTLAQYVGDTWGDLHLSFGVPTRPIPTSIEKQPIRLAS